MKTLKFIPLTLLIMALMSFTGIPTSIASSNDDSHLSQNDSVYSPPGYMNKDIQQARTLTDKYLANKDKADQKTETTQKDVSQKVEMQAMEKPKVELKQKQSSSGNKKLLAGQSNLVDSLKYNVTIGSGTDKIYQNGRLISEKINGTTHIYAGFDNVGTTTIMDAISKASTGDIILVRGGKSYSESIGLTSGITLYGGYDEAGSRDIRGSASIFNGGITANNNTEINGFNINGTLSMGATNAKVYNNTFANRDYWSGPNQVNCVITAGRSSGDIANNLFLGSGVNLPTLSLKPNMILNSPTLVVRNNIFSGDSNALTMFLGTGNKVDFMNNTVHGSIFAAGVYKSVGNNYMAGYLPSWNGNASSRSDYFFGSQPTGTTISNISATQNIIASTDTKVSAATSFSNAFTTSPLDSARYGVLANNTLSDNMIGMSGVDSGRLSSIMRSVLGSAGGMMAQGVSGETLLAKQSKGAVAESTLAIPSQINATPQEVEAAAKLATILKNPTEDQKSIITSVTAILTALSKLDDASAQALELDKAADDLLQVTANILLAQGVPDLLKEGDMENIKSIFSDLGRAKDKLLNEYQVSTKSYYESLVKDIVKNMAMLQDEKILNPYVSKEELSKLPPSELDKILQKIRSMKDRTFEEEYILQQEDKYRKAYLDPGKDKLEKDLREMMKEFTSKLNNALDNAKK